MLLNDLELSAIFQLLTTFDASLDWNRNLLLKVGGNHVPQLIFGFDLLVENSKCDVLKVGQDVLLVIDEGCLSDDVDQPVLFLMLLLSRRILSTYP